MHGGAETSSNPSLRRSRIALTSIVWTLVCTISVLACSLSANASESRPAWGARIVDRGAFSGLVSARGSLYAVIYSAAGPLERGTRVVRIDATSGKILATSAVLPGVDAPVFAGKTLWLSGVTYYSKNAEHEGPSVLDELNPLTLKRERELRTNLQGQVSLLGTSEGTLWEMSSGENSCTFRRIDPSSGMVISTDRVSFEKGPCRGAAFDTAGKNLYVSINAPLGENVALYKLNGQTGAFIARSKIPILSNFTSMAATSTNLWIAGGDPGSDGFLLHLSTSPLKLVAESSMLKGQGETHLGLKGYQLPTFGQFPVVDFSANRIWVASDGGVACFLPTSKKALVYVIQRVAPIITSSFVVAGFSTWAVSNSGSLGEGIVRLARSSPCAR
jgi:hypothetical protein